MRRGLDVTWIYVSLFPFRSLSLLIEIFLSFMHRRIFKFMRQRYTPCGLKSVPFIGEIAVKLDFHVKVVSDRKITRFRMVQWDAADNFFVFASCAHAANMQNVNYVHPTVYSGFRLLRTRLQQNILCKKLYFFKTVFVYKDIVMKGPKILLYLEPFNTAK